MTSQRDSIFWIEVDKIKANPLQPRREFDEQSLQSLAESIRQYGVLQPLVVTRNEVAREDGLSVEYELIAGERRLRASRLAKISLVPAVIRSGEESDLLKLEIAIIENLQREDLNPIDKAKAFEKLTSEFNFAHVEVARKIGKSREYVTNSIRLLSLPEHILEGLSERKITEGHARPLMMLNSREEEQALLFKEIIYKKLSVREAERIARKIAQDRVRKRPVEYDPELEIFENKLTESLGTRVSIEKKENGGKITIDFFTREDIQNILLLLESNKQRKASELLDNFIQSQSVPTKENSESASVDQVSPAENPEENEGGGDIPIDSDQSQEEQTDESLEGQIQDRPASLAERETDFIAKNEETKKLQEEENLYSIKNFD